MNTLQTFDPASITDANYADDLYLLGNASAWAESMLYGLEGVARSIRLYVNSDKSDFMCFTQDGAISAWNGQPLELEDQVTYLGGNISSTESDVNICIGKVLTAINR